MVQVICILVHLVLQDYLEAIRQPMDLSTVSKNLKNRLYFTPSDFIADIRLIFSNAKTYNRKGTIVRREGGRERGREGGREEGERKGGREMEGGREGGRGREEEREDVHVHVQCIL